MFLKKFIEKLERFKPISRKYEWKCEENKGNVKRTAREMLKEMQWKWQGKSKENGKGNARKKVTWMQGNVKGNVKRNAREIEKEIWGKCKWKWRKVLSWCLNG